MDVVNSDIAIIGAGASGIIASIIAAREFKNYNKNYNIILLEKSNRIGKKILITGNGRCNISNAKISSEFYYSTDLKRVEYALSKFTFESLREFFKSIGLEIKQDAQGRAYPYNDQASTVVDLLREEMRYLQIKEFCEFNVLKVEKSPFGFRIESEHIIINCKRIIISTGGKSSPIKGYDGDGYKYMKQFGHRITNIYPALTPIKIYNPLKHLKGVRCQCKIDLLINDNVKASEIGEIQFTDYGLSGICVFQLSRFVSELLYNSDKKDYLNCINVKLDLMPNYTTEDIQKFLIHGLNNLGHLSIEHLLTGILNKKISQCILKHLNLIPLDKLSSNLTENEIKRISILIKNWHFKPIGVMDWKSSQVTAGGLLLSEFNNRTLESKKVSGLYCSGEILDVDGICGGYNLHWAWASGYIAGLSAAKSLI